MQLSLAISYLHGLTAYVLPPDAHQKSNLFHTGLG